MKVKIFFTFLILCLSIFASAQTINLEFPYMAGNTYDFHIFQGNNRVLLQQGSIPKGGKVQLHIPKEHQGYKGMATWYITNSATGGGLDLIINNEDFSVSCLDSIPTEASIIYKNTQENIFDKTNYQKQQDLFQKHDAMLVTTRAYASNTELHKLATREYQSIKEQYAAYSQSLLASPLFAAKFRQIVNLTLGIGTIISIDENERAYNINDFIVNQLDYEALYTSNHWGGIINSWVQLQTQVLKNDDQLVANTKTILNRIKSDKIYTDFVSNLTKELSKVGKDEVISKLREDIKSANRLMHYNGVLSFYQQEITGKAPNLILTEHLGNPEDHNHKTTEIATAKLNSTYSLLVFYQSGCGPCEQTIEGLKANYKTMRAKGVRIISLSADTDQQVFTNIANQFPWQDKYCDLEGLHGINFINYGIIGTPTLYLLDKEGMILQKMSNVEQLLAWFKEKGEDLSAVNEALAPEPKPLHSLQIGNKAPNIDMGTANSSLYAISAEKTIVAFWASWNAESKKEMAKINKWAKANPSTKVLAISLDENQEMYVAAVKSLPNLLHFSDLQKWNGQAVKDYFITNTPIFFVLDKDKNIVGKYPNFTTMQKEQEKTK